MNAQFQFFNADQLKHKPLMANLNYFLTDDARGGTTTNLLGEKQDVNVWLGWLELRANDEVEDIETPIGRLPKYEDLRKLFHSIGKDYPKELYNKQFALYVDNILNRIDLQESAYQKGHNIPPRLFEVYEEQRAELETLKEKYGPIVQVDQLLED